MTGARAIACCAVGQIAAVQPAQAQPPPAAITEGVTAGRVELAASRSRKRHEAARMHVWDVIELFNRTRLGSPVLIR